MFNTLKKLIKKIIKMTDSTNVTEKEMDVVDNVQEVKNETVPTTESDVNESEEEAKAKVLPINPRDDEIDLEFLDKDFVYECMSVPTHSQDEFRMVTFIMLWARRNKIKYEFDDFGNIYLTKGELNEGEFYPCVTSHLDTVQNKQCPYIYAGVPLDLKTERTKDGQHKISVDTNGGSSIGIGADDKGGVCICLSMFKHLDKLKACFFLDEETGCHGSNALDEDWFKDVGYVIGYDSPELYRAAWSCNGVKLFSYEFYTKHMKAVCDHWGLVKGCFFSEPYTDVKNIREKTHIMCMNFGNGGYDPHSATEYCIIEDMEHACGMGIDLVKSIGCTEHKCDDLSSWTNYANSSYKKNSNGVYERIDNSDIEQLKELGDNSRKSYYGYSASTSYNSSSSSSSTSTAKKDDSIKFETVKYVVNRYDSYILGIKEDILKDVKAVCEKSNVDFTEFEKVISEKFDNEIKF
jgi:hypothetical protein